MKTMIFLSAIVGAMLSAQTVEVSLWTDEFPQPEKREDKADAKIFIHHPANPNGTAAIICPGGGYGGLVIGAEGHGIAEWLGKYGITGIVLKYRLPKGRSFVPLADAQRAVRLVRHHAKKWKIDAKKVGIVGFSAGGHLASTAATHLPQFGKPPAKNPFDRISYRPDFAILVYPVVTMGEFTHTGSKRNLLGANSDQKCIDHFSNEKRVTKETPPIFMAHAVDDRPVPPENSRMLYAALQKKNIPSKYMELPDGGHGLNGYKGPSWDAWQTGSIQWLKEIGLLSK